MGVGLGEATLAVQVGLLLAGFGYAAYEDLRTREVTDTLWQVLGVAGLLVGAVALFPGGTIPLLLWLAVGGLAAEHMFAWDQRLGPRLEPYADLLIRFTLLDLDPDVFAALVRLVEEGAMVKSSSDDLAALREWASRQRREQVAGFVGVAR